MAHGFRHRPRCQRQRHHHQGAHHVSGPLVALGCFVVCGRHFKLVPCVVTKVPIAGLPDLLVMATHALLNFKRNILVDGSVGDLQQFVSAGGYL